MNTYYVTLNYNVPPQQNQLGQLNGVNGIQQVGNYQPALAIIKAVNFEVDTFGVTFYNKNSDKLAFFPTGQYRSITKNG